MRRAAAASLVFLVAACGSDAAPGDLDEALAGADSAVEPFEGLTTIDVDVGDTTLSVVVADSESERATGLRGRTDPAPYEGMLFAFDDDSTSRFTMRGVEEPLDLAFYAADGRRLGGHAMTPCPEDADCPSYTSDESYRYALETPAGELPDGPLEPVTARR